jgi:acyl-CoA thioesterase-1
MQPSILRSILPLLLFCFLFTACGQSEQRNLRGQNIICFGDSLTFGTGAPQDKSYPAQLSVIIGRPVINAGIPGDTTTRALQRLDRDVLSQSPRIVLITLGGNDLKNGIDRETAFQNLEKIVRAVQAEGALVVVGGIKLLFWDRGYDEEYAKLAAKTGAILIPNILSGLMGNEKLMSDTIHPNAAGYEIMATRFHKAIEPYL